MSVHWGGGYSSPRFFPRSLIPGPFGGYPSPRSFLGVLHPWPRGIPVLARGLSPGQDRVPHGKIRMGYAPWPELECLTQPGLGYPPARTGVSPPQPRKTEHNYAYMNGSTKMCKISLLWCKTWRFSTWRFHKKKSKKKSNVNFEIRAFFMPFVTEKVQNFFVTLIQCAFPTIIILQILSTTTIILQLHPHFILWVGKEHSELYQWSNIVLKKISSDWKMSVIKFS